MITANIQTKQRGAVLVISLVMMVIMTLLGVFAMDSARFEVVMGQNTQAHITTMASAEQTLLSAEQDLEAVVADGTPFNFTADDDHYYFPLNTTNPDASAKNWDFSHETTSDGKYIIEYWGKTTISGESSAMGPATSGSNVFVFEVSAQSKSGKGAKRAVQSIYLTDRAP